MPSSILKRDVLKFYLVLGTVIIRKMFSTAADMYLAVFPEGLVYLNLKYVYPSYQTENRHR